jgi:hypothetical protein
VELAQGGVEAVRVVDETEDVATGLDHRTGDDREVVGRGGRRFRRVDRGAAGGEQVVLQAS